MAKKHKKMHNYGPAFIVMKEINTMKTFTKRTCWCTWVLFCASYSGTVFAESPDTSFRSYVENHSYSTPCAEVDNVNIPFYAQRVSAFRVTTTHPTYFPAPINERGADFSNCGFVEQRFWTIGREDGSSDQFRRVGSEDSNDFFPADHPPAGKDMKWSEFPRAIGAGAVTDQFIHFTAAEEDSDTNIELKIGADLHIQMSALEGDTDASKLTLRCRTWDGSDWQNRGDRTFTSDEMAQVWNIPDLTWIEGADANIIHLSVVTAEQGGETSPGTRGLYDYVKLQRRDVRGDTASVLIENEFIKLTTVSIDFWWRHPESMTVEVAGGAKATNVHYLRINKRAPHSNPPDADEIFVLYEDGNARIIPLPPESVDWTPYGASIILAPSPDGKRPAAPIDKIIVDPEDLALDVYCEGGMVLHLELWADRTQAVVDVTRLADVERDEPFARLRSMWVYDGKADVDRIQSANGTFPILDGWKSLDGSWWQVAKKVPSYHNTYSPDFRVEILDPSSAYLVWEAENPSEGRDFQLRDNPAAVAGQTLMVSPEGGEVTYRMDLDRSRPATQMRIRYADEDGGSFSTQRGNQLHVYVDGELTASTYTTDTGGWDAFEISPGLYLGDLDQGEHTFKVVVGPGTKGVQLDRFELVSQPMIRRQTQNVLSREAEDLSAGEAYSQQLHDRASGQKTIHMDTKGGAAIFRVDCPVSIKEAYLTLRYSDTEGPNEIQVLVDGEIAAKLPTSSTEGWNDFITSPELFIGPLSKGEHEIRLITSSGTEGVNLDKFAIFTR